MKKIVILIALITLTGCTKGEKIICTLNNQKAEFTLKNGVITKYEINGKSQKNVIVDELNGEYFTSSKNNEEGKRTLYNYVNSQGGSCE